MFVNIISDMTRSAELLNGHQTIEHRWGDWVNNELKIMTLEKLSCKISQARYIHVNNSECIEGDYMAL